MAKNCINPTCGKEIPSSATFCPFCGAQQVENVQLSEEEKLRKEMSEMQETMSLLKKALANAQQNSDSSVENVQEISDLQKQLADMQSKNKTLQNSVKNSQPQKESKSSSASVLTVGLTLLFVVGLVGYFVFYKPNSIDRDAELRKRDRIINESRQERQTESPVAVEKSAISPVEESTKANNSKPAKYASIKGKSVIFRESYSTTSQKLGNLDENEQVVILSEYTPSNTNEAICNKEIKLYNSSGSYIYTIPSGKAVKVTGNNGNTYNISFDIPDYGKMSTKVNRSDIDFISGDKWYSIKRNTGETGWVYSKYVILH
jgi:hypothetical protein